MNGKSELCSSHFPSIFFRTLLCYHIILWVYKHETLVARGKELLGQLEAKSTSCLYQPLVPKSNLLNRHFLLLYAILSANENARQMYQIPVQKNIESHFTSDATIEFLFSACTEASNHARKLIIQEKFKAGTAKMKTTLDRDSVSGAAVASGIS